MAADQVGAPAAPGAGAASREGQLPCSVSDVITRRCASCHAERPLAGVPMPLSRWQDFHAQAPTRPELTVHALAAQRIHDAASPMPPSRQLPPEELATLDAWFESDAPAADGCKDDQSGLLEPSGPPADSTCYTLRAHGAPSPDDDSPWMVGSQHYACFYFDMPWPEGAQGVYFAPEFDVNPELVHHFIVYLDQNGDVPDGHVETCTGLHSSGPTMVAGWAPGSNNNALPPDVGMFLSPANRKILLEMHFFHDGVSAPVPTRSGVKVCTANTPRPNTATVSLLGTEVISLPPHERTTTSGVCTPQSSEDIHILRSWPHMHELGRALETTILRADGETELLGSWPFDFNSQYSFPTPTTIRPGDRLTTSCTFENGTDNTVSTGTDTGSEMCFNFVTAYPAGALASLNLLGESSSLTSSATACLE